MNGSFISAKPEPGEVDALIVYDDAALVDLEEDPSLWELLAHESTLAAGIGDVFCFAGKSASESSGILCHPYVRQSEMDAGS